MNVHIVSEKQKKYIFVTLVFIMLFICFLGLLEQNNTVVSAESTSFIPAAPVGSTSGFVNIEYEYSIVTMNQNATWRFDWGDGTTTDWLLLENGLSAITQTHQWAAVGTYQVRVQFISEYIPHGVWSTPLTVTISSWTPIDLPHSPLLESGTVQGFAGCEYTYIVSTEDPSGNHVSFRFDWGEGLPSVWTSFVPSGTFFIVTHTWKHPGEYSLKIQARNQYYLESSWCVPIQVQIKNTTENNGCSINRILLNGIAHQIFFSSNHNGTFYNSSSGVSSALLWTGGGQYLLDVDGDGQWEFLYAPKLGEIQQIPEKVLPQKNVFSEFTWWLVLIGGIVIGIICVIFMLIKTGYLYFYEVTVVEK
jgi:hypothetical protein